MLDAEWLPVCREVRPCLWGWGAGGTAKTPSLARREMGF